MQCPSRLRSHSNFLASSKIDANWSRNRSKWAKTKHSKTS